MSEREPESGTASRLKVWGGLLALLAISVLFLLAVLPSRKEQGQKEPTVGGIRFHVVDEAGEPVPSAEVFVLGGPDMPIEAAGVWSDEAATLTLPRLAGPSAIAVQARGYRSDVAQNVAEDRTFVLRPGISARLTVGLSDTSTVRPYVLVFQVNPAPENEATLTLDQRLKIVDLMDTLRRPPEGAFGLPAGAFGFAVQSALAAEGILIPSAGRYAVRWGLLDSHSGVWFSLRERVQSYIVITDDERTQAFTIPVRPEDLEKTRRGLEIRTGG